MLFPDSSGCFGIVDIDTARQLLVTSVQEYLSAVNSNEKIKPHLHNYPFTDKNIKIVIYFYDSSGLDVPVGSISIASAAQGELIYYVDYPEKHTIKAIHEESFQDALRAFCVKSSN
jgi:hypothetical protein